MLPRLTSSVRTARQYPRRTHHVLIAIYLAFAPASAEAQITTQTERVGECDPEALGARVRPSQSVDNLGVVSAATFSGTTVSPGQLVTIFGSGIGPRSPVGPSLDENGRVADEAGGVQVLFGGHIAPILYASEGQLNVQVPYEINDSSDVAVSTFLVGRRTGEATISTSPTEIGVFSLDQSSRLAAAFNTDGTLNSPFNPAGPSEFMTLYGTGHGQTTPPTKTGALADRPLPQLNLPIVARYSSGARSGPLEVLYVGPAPGFAGLFQLNVRLPADLGAAHGALSIRLQAGESDDRAYGIVAVSRDRRMSTPDYYVVPTLQVSPRTANPGQPVNINIPVANLGADGDRGFIMWIDFTQGSRTVRGPICEFESGLPSGAVAACRGTVEVPEGLSGQILLRFWVNPFSSFNRRWVAELNPDNNRLSTFLSVSRPTGERWAGVLRFEGQMTLNGRSAPATVDIVDGLLTGQVLGLNPSNTFSMVFTNDGASTVAGDTISYPVRSDSLLFGGTIEGIGRGTFTLTMTERIVGRTVSGTMDITYAGGNRYRGGFAGRVIEARD